MSMNHAYGQPDDAESIGPTLRITPRGRAFLASPDVGAPESRSPAHQASRFLDTQALRIGPSASVGSVIALAPFVEIGGVTGAALDVLITPQALSHALSAGFDGDVIRARLEALHEAYRTGLAHCARREVVASHAAFGYLARRYGLTLVPVMGLAPDAEPTPAQLASIVRFAREKKVKYIFFETLVNPRLAETLAREVGAQTLVFNPIEGLTREEQAAGRGYVALMEENLKNLRTALECR